MSDPSIAETLRALLSRAESGEIESLAAVAVFAGLEVEHHTVVSEGAPMARLIGEVAIMQARLVERALCEEEPADEPEPEANGSG